MSEDPTRDSVATDLCQDIVEVAEKAMRGGRVSTPNHREYRQQYDLARRFLDMPKDAKPEDES